MPFDLALLRRRRAVGSFPTASFDFLSGVLDSRITFSRGTNATLIDSTGRLTYAPANLFTNSEFPNGVIDAPTRGGLLTATTFSGLTSGTGLAFGYDGTTSTFAYKPGAVTGTAYVFSVYVRMDDGGAPVFGSATGSSVNNTFAIGIGGAVSVPTSYIVVNMGGGLYRVSGAAVTGGVPANSGIVKYNSNDNRTFTVSGYQLEAVTYQTTPSTYVATTASAYYGPRFDYDPVTLAPRGLLIEEARTNLLTYSEQFDNAAWPKTDATVTANVTNAPSGTAVADKLAETATTAAHSVSQIVTVAIGTSYTYTVYAKAAERNWIALQFTGGMTANHGAYFDLANGVVGSLINSPASATITKLADGWYRCSLTSAPATGTSTTAWVYTASGNGVVSYLGTAGSGVYLYGAQLEAGSFATSYIPTVASTVTRNADVATMTGTNFSSWYNQSEGTMTVSCDAFSPASAPIIYAISDGTANNRIQSNADAGFHLFVASGGVTQASIDAGTFTANAIQKLAAAYKLNDFAAVIDGGTVGTDISGTVPTVDRLNIGSGATGGSPLNGHIRNIAYFNTRLPNAQLQTLTAPSLATTLSLDFTTGSYNVGF